MTKVAIISGSPSESSRLSLVLNYVVAELNERNVEVEWINVRDLPPEDLIYARFNSPVIQESHSVIEQAKGVIVATPVYKASYTGVLKTYLDLLPQKSLADKSIFPLAIGGTLAHLLVIDYALKPVLSALSATQFADGVYVLDTQVERDERGALVLDPEIKERIDQSIRQFVLAVERNKVGANIIQ